MLAYIAPPRRPYTLPIILRQAEVAAFLTISRHLKPRAILTTLSLRRGYGCPHWASCRARTLPARAWSCGYGKAKARPSDMACCPRNSSRSYGSIGSRIHRAPGSFLVILGHAL